MVYLIIFFAIFLVIGPVLWLRPSKRERELAALRRLVIESGAKVQQLNIRRDPVYSAILDRNPHLRDHVWVRYQWVAEEQDTGPALRESWIQRKDADVGLVWEPRSVNSKEDDAVAALLAPWRENQDVRFLGLELGPRNVAIVWNEKGGQAEVSQLADKVKALFFAAKE